MINKHRHSQKFVLERHSAWGKCILGHRGGTSLLYPPGYAYVTKVLSTVCSCLAVLLNTFYRQQ